MVELFSNYPLTTVTSGGTTAPVSGTVETWTVASAASFPGASAGLGTTFHVSDPALPTEMVLVTNTSGATWTVTRGAENSTPVAHTSGFTIKQVVTAGVLRSLQTSDWVNVVTQFGADPTGTNDSAAAINNAINSLPLSGSPGVGGVVYFPAGTYKVASTITVSAVAPVYLRGAGTQATTIAFYGTGDCFRMFNNYVPSGGSASILVWGGGVSDMTIDGSNATIVSFAFTNPASSAVFTATGSSFTAGTPVVLTGASVPAPFVAGTNYYVVSPSGATFSLAAQTGGTAITATASGSGTVYRQNSGLHIGDMKFAQVERLNIQYFGAPASGGTTVSSPGIGIWIDNVKFWTEDSRFECHLLYNTTGAQIDVTGANGTGTGAHDNCEYRFRLGGPPNSATPGLVGNGMIVTNGSNLYHSRVYVYGGIRSSTNAPSPQNYFVQVVGSSAAGNSLMNIGDFFLEVESDGSAANAPALIRTGAAANQISNSMGHITYSAGSGSAPASSIAGQFEFTGLIEGGDTGLLTPFPSGVPATGTQKTNTGPAVYMCVSGGTVSAILINGVTTGLTSGIFYLPAGMTYQINWTVSPTVNWISAVT